MKIEFVVPVEYDNPPVHVDCEDRLSLCKTICCTKRFPLSPEDIENGFKFDVAKPFLNLQVDGYCHALNRETMLCSKYEERPMSCRVHDCSQLPKVWKDFDKKIVAKEVGERLIQLGV